MLVIKKKTNLLCIIRKIVNNLDYARNTLNSCIKQLEKKTATKWINFPIQKLSLVDVATATVILGDLGALDTSLMNFNLFNDAGISKGLIYEAHVNGCVLLSSYVGKSCLSNTVVMSGAVEFCNITTMQFFDSLLESCFIEKTVIKNSILSNCRIENSILINCDVDGSVLINSYHILTNITGNSSVEEITNPDYLPVSKKELETLRLLVQIENNKI